MMARLGDVATYVNGFAFKPEDWSSEGLPIIRIQDLTGNSYQANRYDGRCDAKYEVNPGDILISWSASLGVYVWQNEKALLNQHIFKVIFNKVEVDKSFFVHQVRNILDNAGTQAHGATMKHLTKPVFDALPFYLPDLPTQRRIAATLDKVSEGIALCKQMLADLDELVKSQFVEMFGDPVKNPMRWPMMALGECLDSIGNGKSFVCENHSREGEFPAVLKLSAATTGTYHPDENKAVMDEDDFVVSAEVHDGDLLFTRKNTPELVGMAAYVFQTPPKLMMPDIIFRLNTDEKHCKKIYLWQLINHTMFRPCIQALANGSAKSMSNISKDKLMKLPIPVPDMGIQEQFIDFFIQTDKSKLAVQQQMAELVTLKKSLMQEYFG